MFFTEVFISVKMNKEQNYFLYQRQSIRSSKRNKKEIGQLPVDLRHITDGFQFTSSTISTASTNQMTPETIAEIGKNVSSAFFLHEVAEHFIILRNNVNDLNSADQNSQRFMLLSALLQAGNLLTLLSKYLSLFWKSKTSVSSCYYKMLRQRWNDLTKNVKYVPREWQSCGNKVKYLQLSMSQTEEVATARSTSQMTASLKSNPKRQIIESALASKSGRNSSFSYAAHSHKPEKVTQQYASSGKMSL